VVRTVHSSRSLADRGLQGWAHRRTDGLVAVCESHAAILRDRFGVAPERVAAVRGAVDSAFFTPEGPDLRAELGIPAGAPVAGIVSRVKPDRRHAELVAAFEPVSRRLPEARLVIVGRGEGLEDLRGVVARSGLGARVIFAGYRRGEELAAAYRTFDVKVLLAEGNDGTCRALLEGMASGRPGVAWAFGAPAESIVHGETGLLAPPDDVAALGQAIGDVLSRPDRGRSLGAAARARMASLYTEEARGRAVEAFLERVLRLPPA
jgi:glycosyltransferase involved in cell wall biosynthesis